MTKKDNGQASREQILAPDPSPTHSSNRADPGENNHIRSIKQSTQGVTGKKSQE